MTAGCKCPVHERSSAECICACLHDGTDPCDRAAARLADQLGRQAVTIAQRQASWDVMRRERDEAQERAARLARLIRTLHPSTPLGDRLVCATCRDDEPWPCPTLLALDHPDPAAVLDPTPGVSSGETADLCGKPAVGFYGNPTGHTCRRPTGHRGDHQNMHPEARL